MTTTIQLQDWTKAYHWVKLNVDLTSDSSESGVQFYCPSKKEKKVSQEDINNVLARKWNTFEQFKKRAFKVWLVDMPETEPWHQGQCTCPYFLKNYICKHLIGIAIRLKMVKPPPAAKDVPINEKRKRGRPKRATRALLVD